MNENTFSRITRKTSVKSVSFSFAELERIAKIIADSNNVAIQIENNRIEDFPIEPEKKKEFRELVSNAQKLSIFVNGIDGDNLIAYEPSIFESHILPVAITSITIETQTHRQVALKNDPSNYVRFHLDFSKLNFGSPKFNADGGLLNISILEVTGDDSAWVTSTFKKLEDRISVARTSRALLHAPGTYFAGLILLVFPAVIFLSDQVYRNHQAYIDSLGIVLRVGALAYAFLFGAVAYRLLFNYGLWTFPSVEIFNDRDKSAKHRKFWFSLTMSLIVSAISYYLYKS